MQPCEAQVMRTIMKNILSPLLTDFSQRDNVKDPVAEGGAES